MGCTWLLLVLFGLLVVAAFTVLAGVGVLLCAVRPSQSDYAGRAAYVEVNYAFGSLGRVAMCSVAEVLDVILPLC
jgi:hypothetical protein